MSRDLDREACIPDLVIQACYPVVSCTSIRTYNNQLLSAKRRKAVGPGESSQLNTSWDLVTVVMNGVLPPILYINISILRVVFVKYGYGDGCQ
jgi:hypothetical protein